MPASSTDTRSPILRGNVTTPFDAIDEPISIGSAIRDREDRMDTSTWRGRATPLPA